MVIFFFGFQISAHVPNSFGDEAARFGGHPDGEVRLSRPHEGRALGVPRVAAAEDDLVGFDVVAENGAAGVDGLLARLRFLFDEHGAGGHATLDLAEARAGTSFRGGLGFVR